MVFSRLNEISGSRGNMCLVSGSLPKILKFLRIFVDVGFVCTSTCTLLLRQALQHTREESYADNKARPEHGKLHALLFSYSVWVLLRPAEL